MGVILAIPSLFVEAIPTLIVLLVLLLILAALPFLLDPEKSSLSTEIRSKLPGAFVAMPEGFVHYELAGPKNGQVVVLIHGFSIPYYVWDPTFAALVDAGFRVLRYDLFGRGYSDRPKASYDRAFFEQQLFNLLEALEISGPVDLIGVSMGAAIAAGFTAIQPQRVRKLVYIGPQHAAFEISMLGVPILGEYLASVFLSPSLPKRQLEYFHQPEKFPDWPARFRDQMKYKGFRRALLATLRNFLSQDQLETYDRAGKLNKPTLLIWGIDDQTVPFSGHERIRKLAEVEFLAVEKAGHLAYYERPEAVNPKLIRFLLGPE
jgi:pimeloyl-ACP methyl ester carboxylesterase